jgi:hypothetical protein
LRAGQYSLQCWGAGCNRTDNNGNLVQQEVYIPQASRPDVSWAQKYDYYELNRLKVVREVQETTLWRQEFDYDRWGNRTINTNSAAEHRVSQSAESS